MTTEEPTLIPDPSEFKILIVDDEPMLRSVIQDFLSMLGFDNQIVAGDGLEALETIRSNELDCVLSDIRMPKMELEELLGILKVEYPELVVIATSGYSDYQSAYNIFHKGAHDFLGKPLNLDALEIALNWVRERQQVLLHAKRLFGKDALPLTMDSLQDRLDSLIGKMNGSVNHFQTLIQTCIRLSGLARLIQVDMEPQAHCDLVTAAILHELGASYQMHALCELPRNLEDDELQLVQEHEKISARIIANALDRPEFKMMIASHLEWYDTSPKAYENDAVEARIAVWLGMINCVDGWLNDRPDRPAVSPAQLLNTLQGMYEQNALPPLKQVIDQWAKVENYYQTRP